MLISKIFKVALSFIFLSFTFFNLIAQPPNDSQTSPSSEPEHSLDNKENIISNWDARLELARVLSYLKKYDESIEEYQKLIQEEPNSVIARREMAGVLFYLGKTDESLQMFSKIPPAGFGQ